jgi:oligoribonuclease NrnB/cAMP/cGMP phosphodiesterase (DHH superfamily)
MNRMIKVFTHTDLDGISCAILAKMVYKDLVDIEFVNYNDVDQKILNYIEENEKDRKFRFCYITDISVNETTAKKINEENEMSINYYGDMCFQLIDHHKTADYLNKYSWAEVESEREEDGKIKLMSGTNLLYENLLYHKLISESYALNEFTNLVRMYDTWEWKTYGGTVVGQMAKDLNDILYIIGRDDFINSYVEQIVSLGEMFSFKLIELHTALLKYKRQEIDFYINKKLEQVKVIDRVAFVVADSNISELGNKICETVDCDYCAIYTGFNMSLRSIGDFDVSEIAKKHGGGGHKNAAGMPCVGLEELFKVFNI